MDRKEGYYWVKWDLPSMGWSVCYWNGTDWYAINCEEAFSDAAFEIISPDPITEPS